MSLTSKFMRDPLAFAQVHSISPPHGVETIVKNEVHDKPGEFVDTKTDYKGEQAKKLAVDASFGSSLADVGYSRVMRSKKIGYIEMYSDVRGHGGSDGGNNEGKDVVRMRSQFSPFGEAVPVYFLPWDDRGFIVKLRIPKAVRGDGTPDIFFTAAINGCSVFMQGAADAPTIYHAGGPTGIKDPSEAARMWRTVLNKHVMDSRTAMARGRVGGEVNKTNYIKSNASMGGQSTVTADNYERELHSLLDKKGSFRIETIYPWGCVFGIRINGDWAFYLQENATVSCHYVRKKDVRTVMYARPIQISKVFPGGSSRIASMSHTVPVKIKWD